MGEARTLLRDWRSPLCERLEQAGAYQIKFDGLLEQAIVEKVCGYGLVQPRSRVPWALSLENGRSEKRGPLIPVKKMTII